MSDLARRDLEAFEELDGLIRALGEEMASWRRRAKQAESRVEELERLAERGLSPAMDARVTELERENAELRTRLDGARQRTLQLLNRMRFLRQQHGQAEPR